jgi:hypothetical protein
MLLLPVLFYFLHGVSALYAPEIITTRTTQLSYPSPYGPITLWAWAKPNCNGSWQGVTVFDTTNFARNLSNFVVSRSFKISRPLKGQEQLDISLATDLSSWYHNKDQLSRNSSSCNSFKNSYFAWNGTTDCHSTPAFTCHRLWLNPGLVL